MNDDDVQEVNISDLILDSVYSVSLLKCLPDCEPLLRASCQVRCCEPLLMLFVSGVGGRQIEHSLLGVLLRFLLESRIHRFWCERKSRFQSSNHVLSSYFVLVSECNSRTVGHLSLKLYSVQECLVQGMNFINICWTRGLRALGHQISVFIECGHFASHLWAPRGGAFCTFRFGSGSFQFTSYLKITLSSCERSQHEQMLPKKACTKAFNCGCCSVQCFCPMKLEFRSQNFPKQCLSW